MTSLPRSTWSRRRSFNTWTRGWSGDCLYYQSGTRPSRSCLIRDKWRSISFWLFRCSRRWIFLSTCLRFSSPPFYLDFRRTATPFCIWVVCWKTIMGAGSAKGFVPRGGSGRWARLNDPTSRNRRLLRTERRSCWWDTVCIMCESGTEQEGSTADAHISQSTLTICYRTICGMRISEIRRDYKRDRRIWLEQLHKWCKITMV